MGSTTELEIYISKHPQVRNKKPATIKNTDEVLFERHLQNMSGVEGGGGLRKKEIREERKERGGGGGGGVCGHSESLPVVDHETLT